VAQEFRTIRHWAKRHWTKRQEDSSAAPEHRGIAEETVGQRLSSARQSYD